MKNYPLLYSDATPLWRIWINTYLKEINTKIHGLKNYSDYFLTDYNYQSVLWIEESSNVYRGLSQLSFHQYTEMPYTGQVVDANNITRNVNQGDLIVSFNRIEGGVDSGGGTVYELYTQDDEELLNLANEAWTYVNLAQSNRDTWDYYFVQKRALAGYYLWSTIDATTRQARLINKVEKNLGLQVQFILAGEGNRLTAVNNDLFLSSNSINWLSQSLLTETTDNRISDSNGNCWTDATLFPGLTVFRRQQKEIQQVNRLYLEPIVWDMTEKVSLSTLDGLGRLCYTTTVSKDTKRLESCSGFVL